MHARLIKVGHQAEAFTDNERSPEKRTVKKTFSTTGMGCVRERSCAAERPVLPAGSLVNTQREEAAPYRQQGRRLGPSICCLPVDISGAW